MTRDQEESKHMRIAIHKIFNGDEIQNGINRIKFERFILTTYPVSPLAMKKYINEYYIDAGDIELKDNIYKRITPLEVIK